MNSSTKKCIYLVGPSSTGKSTLAAKIVQIQTSDLNSGALPPASLFPSKFLTEVARKVMKSKDYSVADVNGPRCFLMQEDIFHAQFDAEEKFFFEGTFYISDRSCIDPIIFTRLFSSNGRENSEALCLTREWKLVLERYKNREKSLIVLLPPVEKFLKDDGVRHVAINVETWWKEWKEYFEFMTKQEIPFKIMPESATQIDERVDQIYQWLQE